MKLLLDECLPRKLKSFFSQSGHHCTTVREAGFGSKENGELLAMAEGNYDVLVTIDKTHPLSAKHDRSSHRYPNYPCPLKRYQ
jgi:predicted nuclease of predicted toxin-antitoxin system